MTALLAGTLRRNLIELRRYSFETVMQIAGLTALFLLIFYGARGIAGDQFTQGGTQASLVTGYVVFGLVLMAYMGLASWVSQEALLGTLEQITMSPYGLRTVLVAEYVTAIAAHLVTVTGVLLVTMAVTGQWLHFDLVTLVPLVAGALVGVLGLALAMAGAALVFKRVTSLIMFMQFGFLALVAAPIAQYEWLRFAPVSLAHHLIRQSTVEEVRIFQMPAADLLVVAGTAVAYLLAGLAVFGWSERTARSRGLIGQY